MSIGVWEGGGEYEQDGVVGRVWSLGEWLMTACSQEGEEKRWEGWVGRWIIWDWSLGERFMAAHSHDDINGVCTTWGGSVGSIPSVLFILSFFRKSVLKKGKNVINVVNAIRIGGPFLGWSQLKLCVGNSPS